MLEEEIEKKEIVIKSLIKGSFIKGEGNYEKSNIWRFKSSNESSR
jgi:hypothetical protein